MLRLHPHPWNDILRHARACYPLEACGILLGTSGAAGDRSVTQAVLCPNADPGDQSKRFAIDPQDLFDAIHTARSLHLDVLGFFHSHPGRDAYFSPTDLAHTWPSVSNLVLSIRHGEFSQARSFCANRDLSAVAEEPLQLPVTNPPSPSSE